MATSNTWGVDRPTLLPGVAYPIIPTRPFNCLLIRAGTVPDLQFHDRNDDLLHFVEIPANGELLMPLRSPAPMPIPALMPNVTHGWLLSASGGTPELLWGI